MKIAIVDDNVKDAELLKRYLEQYTRSHQIQVTINTFSDGYSLLHELTNGLFDIYFLDICMEEMNGISLAEQVRAVDANNLILFTTTSKDYAIDAYRVRAFHYLLKPLTAESLSNVMDLCLQVLAKSDRYIQIKCNRALTNVPIADIIYTDYSNHFIYLYLKPSSGGRLRTSMTFPQFYQLLSEYPQFLHCYRNTLINMDEVDRMEQDGFLMSSGVKIPMWRDQKPEMQKRYSNYIFGRLNGR